MEESGVSMSDGMIPARSFCGTLAVNVDNEKLSDAEFRDICRNTLPSVDYNSKCKCGQGGQRRWLDRDERGYWCSKCWTEEILSMCKPIPKSPRNGGVDHYPAMKIYRWVSHHSWETGTEESKQLIEAPAGSSIEEDDLWRKRT
jgi:hypothetical protein